MKIIANIALCFLVPAVCLVVFLIPGLIVNEIEFKVELPVPEIRNTEEKDEMPQEQTEKNKEEKKPVFLKLFEDKKRELVITGTDFLEVNLSKMIMRVYRNSLIEKEVPILTKGNPQKWGGSAVGLYDIISGNKLGFSGISEVYMPHSLHYYGKYYIHGEPYYPNGEKLVSSFSGGCLRLKNEDAETIYDLTDVGMPVLVIDKERELYGYHLDTTDFPNLSAESYLVADMDSGFLFAEKNFKEELPIASLTKLMTAVVIAENKDLSKSIFVTEKMLDAKGSTEGIEEGKIFLTVGLFYPLLIESSNDAAEILSYSIGRTRTIRLMNEKAGSILMSNTHFTDPSGLNASNTATAKDLFYLARYIFNNRPPILKITKGEKVTTFGEIMFDIKELWNKNIFINDPTFMGGKTGYTKEAKNTALFIFRLTDDDDTERNIAIILLGSNNIQTDTHKVYGWLLNNYFKL